MEEENTEQLKRKHPIYVIALLLWYLILLTVLILWFFYPFGEIGVYMAGIISGGLWSYLWRSLEILAPPKKTLTSSDFTFRGKLLNFGKAVALTIAIIILIIGRYYFFGF